MATHHASAEGGDFGPIPMTEERLQDLQDLVHPHSRLQKAGYVLWPLSRFELEKKKRCESCSKAVRSSHERQKSRPRDRPKLAPTFAQQVSAGEFDHVFEDGKQQQQPPPQSQQATATQSSHSYHRPQQADDIAATQALGMLQDMELNNENQTKSPPMRCKYHPGTVRRSFWSCCQRGANSPPCTARQYHVARSYRPGELEDNWQYFTTPHPEAHLADTRPATASSTTAHSAVVVIDCEMGMAQSGESELIRVSAVDFFTRAVLVDRLVWPDVPMAHLNTRYSGVTRQGLEQAFRAFRAFRTLAGRSGARDALWRFVGPHTILVGHSVHSDLNALRWIHHAVIDTLLLEMRIQPPREDKRHETPSRVPFYNDKDNEDDDNGGVSLQAATDPAATDNDNRRPSEEGETTTVGKQTAPTPLLTTTNGPPQPNNNNNSSSSSSRSYPGLSLKALAAKRLGREIQVRGRGHDSLEDALATRDLLLWHLVHRPEPPSPADEPPSPPLPLYAVWDD